MERCRSTEVSLMLLIVGVVEVEVVEEVVEAVNYLASGQIVLLVPA